MAAVCIYYGSNHTYPPGALALRHSCSAPVSSLFLNRGNAHHAESLLHNSSHERSKMFGAALHCSPSPGCHFTSKCGPRASLRRRFADVSTVPTRRGFVVIQHGRHRRGGQNLWRPRTVGASAAGVMALKSVVDQVLLVGTVFGVYIAGVAALPRIFPPTQGRDVLSARQDSPPSYKSEKEKPIQDQNSPDSPQSFGEDCWPPLRTKLIQAVSNEASETEEEEQVKYPRLGLQAVARVPKLNLLLATLHHLRKEVAGISDVERYSDPKQWQELSLNVLSCLVEPVCRDWLSQELLQTQMPTDELERGITSAGMEEENLFMDEVNSQRGMGETSNSMEPIILDSMMDVLKESESLPSYIARSGKSGLYADLIFFWRFGSVRSQGCCDHRVFRKHQGNILEDMVVAVAEVVATLFLDCSSNASLSPHGEIWQTILLPSILSSRSLERFRNEVALSGWVNQNFSSVAAMFEDRFELWTVQRGPIPSPAKKHCKALSKKPAKTVAVQPTYVVLMLTEVPGRRSGELKALTGWRYYYSLFLEFSDVVGPLLRILASKLGDAISFLLTILIGRSLGLVYQGIRQSIRWPPSQKPDRS